MKAFRLVEPTRTELVECERPRPGPDEVVLRVGSASFCHSDITLVGMPKPFFDLPVTLGHELAGWIEEVGSEVGSWPVGTAVAVHIIQGCGECTWCIRGQDNRCLVGSRTPGVHYDGGLAEYVRVPARFLVALDGVDMVQASPLTDAGLTSYHSVDLARHALDPTRFALVIGVGGLGHLAIQIIAATTGAEVLAVDITEDGLELARSLGATATFLAGPDTAEQVRSYTGGVHAVLDYVGSQDSVDLAARSVLPGAQIVVTGLGGGDIGMSSALGGLPGDTRAPVPPEVNVVRSFAGGMNDLVACLSLARRGKLRVETTRFALEDAQAAFDALATHAVRGRVVVTP